VNLQFSPCDVAEVHDFVVMNHYLHSCSGAGLSDYCFAAYGDGILVGAAVFGHTAGNAKTGSIFSHPYDTKDYCRELTRLVLSDDLPKKDPDSPHCPSYPTRFLKYCRKWLQQNTDIAGLLSYADPEQKNPLTGKSHEGVIYRADNWEYTGLSNASEKIIVGGEEMHRRRATNVFGTTSVSKIRAMGHIVDDRTARPKHRFVFVLHKALMPFLKYKIVPFALLLLLAVGSLTTVHSVRDTMMSALRGATRGLRAIAKWFSPKREVGAS
jgi:hypothetical protein